MRSADTIGRFGGEEFVIVLLDATASVAMMVAERVRVAIQAGGDNPCVTISIGVAELAIGEACNTLLRRADQALYVAKREAATCFGSLLDRGSKSKFASPETFPGRGELTANRPALRGMPSSSA
ncbi:GGDEF domain-containing protein [Sphingomonas hankookensis]|uniref:GGDEF domain-containing protein n=1 Tax=Sphingomonas hankookensis TaxID=563996 RepID=UPI003B673CD9